MLPVVYPDGRMPNDREITVLRRVLLLLQMFLDRAIEYKVHWDKVQADMFCRLSLRPAQMGDFCKVVDGCKQLVHGIIRDEDISNCNSKEVEKLLTEFKRTYKALRANMSWYYGNLTSRKRLVRRMVHLCVHVVEVHNDLGEIIEQQHSEKLLHITQSLGEVCIQDTLPRDILLPFESMRL